MMPVITVTKKLPATVAYLRAECGVRYWEDGYVNGQEDADGKLIPCRSGEYWAPEIRLESGIISDWPKGTIASIHYKVCDDGKYELLDESREVVLSIDGYVPKIMCPGGCGYGDYVIMEIGGDGRIANWLCDLRCFTDAEDA